ncbi:MAG: hypothetical protein PUP46_09970 [Endozoicomonas sp. (ex Botrylloides leachii)]|nr:hypothetical protein [Endozoicomonas sp. (ex Botrylloides leachii)]
MRTRGKIWNPGAATFQRVCFPGYGDDQSDRQQVMPAQRSPDQEQAYDKSFADRVNRVDRAVTINRGDYVLPMHNQIHIEPEYKETAVPSEPLFGSSSFVSQEVASTHLSSRLDIKPEVAQMPPNYASPMQYAENYSQSLDSDSRITCDELSMPKKESVPAQQEIHNIMQREIKCLGEQLTATLISSVNALVKGQQEVSPESSIPISATLPQDHRSRTNETGRVQVAKIDSDSVSSYEQKTLQANKPLSFYANSHVPKGVATSYQSSGNRHKVAKALEEKLCISLPGGAESSFESGNLLGTSKVKEKVTDSELNNVSQSSNWQQQFGLLKPFIQTMCQEFIQEELQSFRAELTEMIKEKVQPTVISQDHSKESTDALTKMNSAQQDKGDSIKAAEPSESTENHTESTLIKQTSDNVSRLGCFSEAGAVAYRHLRKNPEKVIRFQQKITASNKQEKDVPKHSKKITVAQGSIKRLREQLNMLVHDGSQFFVTSNEKKVTKDNQQAEEANTLKKNSLAPELEVSEATAQTGLNSHEAIAKYKRVHAHNIAEPASNDKPTWRWGGSSPRSTVNLFSKVKPTL